MAITALKIYNLDGKVPAEVATTNLPLAKAKTEDGTSLSWTDIPTKPFEDGRFPKLYQVEWTDEKSSNKARGYTNKYSDADHTFILSNLEPVGSFGISINGKLEITDPKVTTPNPPTAVISVRMGNMGRDTYGQWVIDLSDKQDDADAGSKINVTALINWVKDKASETKDPEIDPEIKTSDGTPLKDKLNDFMINFEQFHFNITKKTFDIDIRSSQDSQIQFGAFVLKEVGFQLTNEVKKPTKQLPEPKEEDEE